MGISLEEQSSLVGGDITPGSGRNTTKLHHRGISRPSRVYPFDVEDGRDYSDEDGSNNKRGTPLAKRGRCMQGLIRTVILLFLLVGFFGTIFGSIFLGIHLSQKGPDIIAEGIIPFLLLLLFPSLLSFPTRDEVICFIPIHFFCFSPVLIVLEARDIKPMDRDGAPDPYCEVELGPQIFRTDTIWNSFNPAFSQAFKA